MTSEPNLPMISAIISTRARPAGAARAVESILRNRMALFEMIAVDQSEDDQTRSALARFCSDPRLRLLSAEPVGVAGGRNIGVRAAHGELLAFTDDDCTVAENWLDQVERSFERDPRIDIVLGNVLACRYDRSAGFAQAYVRKEPFLGRGIRDKHRVEGIGACMAIRRRLWDRFAGFDEMLGAGAAYKSGEDSDMIIHALLEGSWVYENPALWVTHHGFRNWEDGSRLIQDYMFGLAAAYAKQLKCGRWLAAYPMTHLLFRWAFSKPVVDLGRCPPRGLRMKAFLEGLAAGVATPIDPVTHHYMKAKTPRPKLIPEWSQKLGKVP